MTETITRDTIHRWIDDDLVNSIEQYTDDVAEFNFTVEISNLLVHVIRRQPEEPLLIGQEIEYGEDIQSRIRDMDTADRNELVARIRETLTASPIIYGFHDDQGNNVRFQDLQRIFIEYRIYPGNLDQHALMTGLIDVWKVMRYVDDIVTLIDAVEN